MVVSIILIDSFLDPSTGTLRDFGKFKKLGGWPQLGFFFFLGNNVVLFVFCVMFLYMFQKKMDSGVGGYCLANQSFSRIFGFFLT